MSNKPSTERDNGHGFADERTRLINSEKGHRGFTLDAQAMDLRAPAPLNGDDKSGYQSQLAENLHRNVEESDARPPSTFEVPPPSPPSSSVKMRTRNKKLYWAFSFLGLSTLIPYNFFITPAAYWQYKFRNVTGSSNGVRTRLQEKFEADLVTVMLSTNVVFLIIASTLTYNFKPKSRVMITGLFTALILALTSSLVLIDSDSWQQPFYNGTLASVVFVIACAAIMQSGVIGLAATMEPQFMQAVVNGQACSGTFSSLVSVLSFAVIYTKDDEKRDRGITYCTFFYFAVGVVCMFACSFVMNALPSEEDLRVTPKTSVAANQDSTEGRPLMHSSEQRRDNGRTSYTGLKDDEIQSLQPKFESKRDKMCGSYLLKHFFLWLNNLWRVLLEIKPEALALFINFVATLTVFPAIDSLIKPIAFDVANGTEIKEKDLDVSRATKIPISFSNQSLDGNSHVCQNSTTDGADHSSETTPYGYYFTPVFCFLFFNLSDLIGRETAARWQWPNKDTQRWILPSLTSLRLIFIPLFMFCNVVLSRPRIVPVYFLHDAVPLALTLLHGFTSGYFASIVFTLAPRRARPEDAEMAGAILCVIISIGLATGTALSLKIINVL